MKSKKLQKTGNHLLHRNSVHSFKSEDDETWWMGVEVDDRKRFTVGGDTRVISPAAHCARRE